MGACKPDCPYCPTFCSLCGSRLVADEPYVQDYSSSTGEPRWVVDLACPNQPRTRRGRAKSPWHSSTRHYT